MRLVATDDRSIQSRFRALKRQSYLDVTAAVANLSDELIEDPVANPQTATDALDRLRHRLRASHAILWSVAGATARQALRAGPTDRGQRCPLDLDASLLPLDRLRRNGTVFCGIGEVSGIEDLAPEGVSAFVAAAATQADTRSSVLVLGWTDAAPERDTRSFALLRIAAALLGRAASTSQGAGPQLSLAETVAQSLHDKAVAVDPEGTADLRVRRIVDALPAHVWIADPHGRVSYASRRWAAACAGIVRAPNACRWQDALHADDRERADAVFAAAVSERAGFELGVRLWSHGTYGSFTCVAAPLFDASGTLDGYVGVCVDISARHRAESAVDDIAARLLTAQEAERSRIARDLHDDLGQQVVLLETTIEAALSRGGSDQARSVLMATRAKLGEIAASIHTLAYSLHPAKLKLLGLVQTLQTLCRDVAAEAGHGVRFAAHDVPPDIDEDVVLCIFRVAQEALQNAVKHSGARTIDVHLSGAGPRLVFRVVDDGGGFDADVPGGLGMLTMRERVELVGGTLTVTTAQTRGTAIEVVVNARRRAAPV